MFNPSPIYSARKSSNNKLSINHKISPHTNLHETYISPDTNSHKTYTNIEHKIFEELVPSVSPLLKKQIRLGHIGIVDHSVDLSISYFKKVYKKRNGQKQKKNIYIYIYIYKNA